MSLPKLIVNPIGAPIIIHGSKLKLIQWMFKSIQWNGKGRYIEPFLGSGVVFLNLLPKRSLVNDKNPHIIRLYKDLYEKKLHLKEMGEKIIATSQKILDKGTEVYYEIRDQFNSSPSTEHLIILSITSYRNLMRFNSKGEFNAPPNIDDRTLRGGKYAKMIVKRIRKTEKLLSDLEIEFYNEDYRTIFEMVQDGDFLYLDPPYVKKGGYIGHFDTEDLEWMVTWMNETQHNFAFSHWYKDKNEINPYLSNISPHLLLKFHKHSYRIGDKNKKLVDNINQNVVEVLVIPKQCAAKNTTEYHNQTNILNF